VAHEAGHWCQVIIVTVCQPAQSSIVAEDPPHEQWLVRLEWWVIVLAPYGINVAWACVVGMVGLLLVINLVKKTRILMSVKKNNEEGEKTYLLDFETLSNMGISCRIHKMCMMWHICNHVYCHLLPYNRVQGVLGWLRWWFALNVTWCWWLWWCHESHLANGATLFFGSTSMTKWSVCCHRYISTMK